MQALDVGYEHEPLTFTDAWRCLYHARVKLMLVQQAPLEAYALLWEAQDALTSNREVNVEEIYDRLRENERAEQEIRRRENLEQAQPRHSQGSEVLRPSVDLGKSLRSWQARATR